MRSGSPLGEKEALGVGGDNQSWGIFYGDPELPHLV